MSRLYAYMIAGIGALVIGFSAGWQVNGWRWEARSNAAAEAARSAERAAQQDVIDSLKKDIRASQESSDAYQDELTRLRNQPVPIPTVRVCKPAHSPSPDLPAAGGTSRGPDASGKTGGVGQDVTEVDSGADIGPGLTILADELDHCLAQLRGLQDWVRRTR